MSIATETTHVPDSVLAEVGRELANPPGGAEHRPTILQAAAYALDMLRQRVPDGGKEVTLAERLAGMGGLRAERLLETALGTGWEPFVTERIPSEPPASDENATPLLRRFAELQLKRRELEDALDVVTKQVAALEPQVLESFVDQGITSANVCGLCCYVKTDLYVSKRADKDGATTEALCEALTEVGLGYMVKDGYSASSLKSKVAEWRKDGVEIPERLAKLLNVGEIIKVQTRKA